MPAALYLVNGTNKKDAMSPAASLSDHERQDETQDFNLVAIRATLRGPDKKPCELVKNYNWYLKAVPVDALLPSGMPLSAKEICAYYPHHVR